MSAVLSACERYRYRLEREIAAGSGGPVYAFFGVNPSTADANEDDATVRKWRGFVSRWGGSRFVVGNVFAYRATDVRELATTDYPVGRENNDHLAWIMGEADILVPCWGNQSKVAPDLRCHFRWILQKLHNSGKPVKTFGLSKRGDPIHPLMLSYKTPLVDLHPY